MKPGKRPSSPNPRRNMGSLNDRDAPRVWDNRFTTKLQRCISTHDIFHILTWHTPSYSLVIYLSIILTCLGASSFKTISTYLSLLISFGIVFGGIAKYFQVESGPFSIVTSSTQHDHHNQRVGTKFTGEANLRVLYSRLVEPLIKFFMEDEFCSSWKGLLVIFVSVTIIGEAAKYYNASSIICVVTTILFGVGRSASIIKERMKMKNDVKKS